MLPRPRQGNRSAFIRDYFARRTNITYRPVPHTDADYRELVELLDRITDEVGENENHSLASLMDVLGVLIEKYEDEHVPELTE